MLLRRGSGVAVMEGVSATVLEKRRVDVDLGRCRLIQKVLIGVDDFAFRHIWQRQTTINAVVADRISSQVTVHRLHAVVSLKRAQLLQEQIVLMLLLLLLLVSHWLRNDR